MKRNNRELKMSAGSVGGGFYDSQDPLNVHIQSIT